jgi:AraC-like DNA-binding protein
MENVKRCYETQQSCYREETMKSKESKPKSKSNNRPKVHATYPPGASPSEIARLAGCSRALAHRLIARGMSPEQIVERCRLRREREAARAAERERNIPSGVTDRNGAGNGAENFTQAQTRKEIALASKHETQLGQLRADLAPVRELNAWYAAQIIHSRELLGSIAGILSDRLAAETNPGKCGALVDAEIRRALASMTLFGERYAATLKTGGEKTERLRELVRQIVGLLDEE